MPYYIPCEIDGPCASLEHTWLKNRLLNQLRVNRQAWIESTDDTLPSVLVVLPFQITKVKDLIELLCEGFSPALLVDRVPLFFFSDEVKDLIKNSVHHAYLELNLIQPLIEELRKATNELEAVAETISVRWHCGTQARSELIQEVESAAVRLRSTFLALPREVVLP